MITFGGATAHNLHPKTATLYSAALSDGDYHTRRDALTSFFLGVFTPFNEKMQLNRIFSRQMYREYHERGLRDILDIGAGPMPRAHVWAPGGRYLYIDHNPEIVAHAQRKLRKGSGAHYVTGAVGDIPRLFNDGLGARAFSGNRKIAVGCNAVLMFASDSEIRNDFTYLHRWAARGSIVTISMIGITVQPTHYRARLIERLLRWIGAPMSLRNIDSFAALFDPWTVVRKPVTVSDWLGLPPSVKTAGIGFDTYAMQLIKD